MTTATETSTKDDKARAAAVKLLAKGLATPSEVAKLAGVSRQLVAHWSRGINWRRARAEFLSRSWQRFIRA